MTGPLHRLARRTLLAALLATPLAAAPLHAETLTIAIGGDVNTLDPHNTATVNADLTVLSHLYTPLVTRGPDMKLHPALATAWKAIDPHTWRFTLRTGLKFADGEALDASVVKANLDRVRDPKLNARLRPWFKLVSGETVISPTEIEIKTSEPYPALPGQLSMFFLLPPKWLAGGAKPAQEVMPSGPYQLAQRIPGDRVVLTARPGYTGPRPVWDKVVFKVIPDMSSQIAALLAGEVDFITGLPPSEMPRINKSGRATAAATDSIRSFFIRFNNLKPPFKDNPKLRRALNYAVDKQAIVDSLLGGYGHVSSCQILTPAYFGYNPALKPIPYDPAKARALLKEAGVTTPLTVDFDVPTGRYLLASEITQAVAAQLADVGVIARIHEMDFGSFMNKYLRAHDLAAMGYISLAWPTLDGDGLLSFLETGNNYAYWDDATFTKLLRASRSAPGEAERGKLLEQADARACDQAPLLFLFVQPTTYGLSKRVTWHARGDDWVRAGDFTPR